MIKRLMLAVLLNAIRCYQSNFGARSVRQRIEFYEARQWLFDGCSEGPFSLHSVCSVLGIEPRKVQRAVSDWVWRKRAGLAAARRSEEHTSELQSHLNLVCRLLLEKNKSHHDPAHSPSH